MFKIKIRIKRVSGGTTVDERKFSVLSFITYLVNLGFKSAARFKIMGGSLELEEVE